MFKSLIRASLCRKTIFLKLAHAITACLLTVTVSFAQMGISSTAITPDASSILEMRSTTRGMLTPRMTATERNAIASPATGLVVYNTTTNNFNYYNGTAWVVLFSGTAVNAVNGTANRVSIGGTAADPIIDISSAYTGQPSITTLGTITTGTWNGTAIGVARGGTNITSYTTGDLLYASGATTLSKLAGVATGNVLISGGVGTAPSWGKIGLTTHVSGILPIANGGTNSTAVPTAGAVAYGNGTSYQITAAGTSGQILQSAGAGAPVWVNGGTMMLTGNTNDKEINNQIRYFPVMGVTQDNTADVSAVSRTMISRSGTIKNFYVRLGYALVAGKVGTVTVTKNGVATALSVTLDVGSLLYSDLSSSISVSPGDEISIQINTTGKSKFSWAMDFYY